MIKLIMKNKELIIVHIAVSLLLAFLVTNFCAYGKENDLYEERMHILQELGLPLPDSGIKLVPRATFNLTKDEIALGLYEEQQMREQGYIKDSTTRAQELIYLKQHAIELYKVHANITNDLSTHLRQSSDNLKLGFQLKTLPQSLTADYIGIVPQGGFHQEGWSGAVQFFISKDIGTCAYGQMNVAVSHTAIELAIEDATYIINGKLSLYEARGSKRTGFIYKVRWFDNDNFHELECANMKYSNSYKDKVINLANIIDAS